MGSSYNMYLSGSLRADLEELVEAGTFNSIAHALKVSAYWYLHEAFGKELPFDVQEHTERSLSEVKERAEARRCLIAAGLEPTEHRLQIELENRADRVAAGLPPNVDDDDSVVKVPSETL